MTESQQALSLQYGGGIKLEGLGTFTPPKLHDLAGGDSGYKKYDIYLRLFTMSSEDFADSIGAREKYDTLSFEDQQRMTPLFFLTENPEFRRLFIEALDFFMAESPRFDPLTKTIFFIDDAGEKTGVLDSGGFYSLSAIIRASACIEQEDKPPKKFRNEATRKRYLQLQAGRKKLKKASQNNSDLDLSNVISAVCARHPSYNLLNIWDMTIYQLYDTFARMNVNFQVDVSSLRWAAWGKDPFDMTLWYKSLK